MILKYHNLIRLEFMLWITYKIWYINRQLAKRTWKKYKLPHLTEYCWIKKFLVTKKKSLTTFSISIDWVLDRQDMFLVALIPTSQICLKRLCLILRPYYCKTTASVLFMSLLILSALSSNQIAPCSPSSTDPSCYVPLLLSY